jgi:hypothetical protein
LLDTGAADYVRRRSICPSQALNKTYEFDPATGQMFQNAAGLPWRRITEAHSFDVAAVDPAAASNVASGAHGGETLGDVFIGEQYSMVLNTRRAGSLPDSDPPDGSS